MIKINKLLSSQIFQEPKKASQVEQVLNEFSRCIQVTPLLTRQHLLPEQQ